METSKIKKMVFGGLLLMSAVQIIQHFIEAPDYIYGGLFGMILGVMFLGIFKVTKLKKNTSNR
ncbi:hypothetical protein ACT3CE_00545 [Marinifilum sp. RC60d5]|uniref:hypothetical protein n=1 Tax=Marinifilum sp. RC60d5 TaxID=3458414 RepID=UPI0040375759